MKIRQLAERRDEVERMGENGRKLAENKYNWRMIAKSLEDAYYSVINERKSKSI